MQLIFGVQKMNIIVIAGGLSPERDVSLSSGSMIANALMEYGHNVLLMDIYMGLRGADNFQDAYTRYKKDKYEYTIPAREPDLDALRAARGGMGGMGGMGGQGGMCVQLPREQQIGDGVLSICAGADIVFNALHGAIGENGQIQAVFDVYGVKYTGTGYEGSFLAMDKPLAKELMRLNGIRTPDWTVMSAGGAKNIDDLNFIPGSIGLPCVIKPCGCGSSVGVSIVNNRDEMAAALDYAFKYESRIIIEKMIMGREFSVGVLGGAALPPIEIIPREGFFDYKNKYQPNATVEVCPPAGLSRDAEMEMRDLALRAHEILRLGDYSRLDLILSDDNLIYCLETNTLPGMTPASLLPKEAAAGGIAYPQLCDRIVRLAMERY